jgi:predicted permease
MTERQRENIVKYVYDLSKGIVLIVGVGGAVNGQISLISAILGSATAIIFVVFGFWLDRKQHD